MEGDILSETGFFSKPHWWPMFFGGSDQQE